MATTSDPADDGQQDPDGEKVRYLDAAEVAAIMGGKYTAGTVKRRYRHWGLTAYKAGRELRWLESDVYSYMEKRRVN
jgi:hypothetical protein